MLKIKSIYKFFTDRVFLDSYEKTYINFNNAKWKDYKNTNSKNIILVDLFPWYPFIHFWSYIVNILAKKNNAQVKYFYFDLYQGKANKLKYYIHKLKKIFNSFNVTEGISEYNFEYSTEELKKFEKNFSKNNYNISKLIKYKKKGIKIGDLIHDTYLRVKYKPTVDVKSADYKKIFFRAEKIFEEVDKYLNKNKVIYIIPSHVCFISYGIIARLAVKKKIPILKIKSHYRGNALFRLHKVDSKYVNDENPYHKFNNIFSKLPKHIQEKSLKTGKEIIKKRVSGNYDRNLPYMTTSAFHNKISDKNDIKISNKKKFIIFPHCYFDNPNRFRKMIFYDFYHQVKYILDLSKKLKNFEWYYKPHPNELQGDLNVHKEILKKYPHVNYLSKNISHKNILKINPSCIITNHGTIAHEYAYFKVPVINTGDNPHINYNFCLHASSKKQLREMIINLDRFKKRLQFDKIKIYEYMFLEYVYFPNLNNEKKHLKDEYFATKDVKVNRTSKVLKYLISKSNNLNIDNNIKNYVLNYINNNF